MTAKERVERELYELSSRIVKLTEFLYSMKVEEANITSYMKALLHEQLSLMQRYANVLKQRLIIWDNTEEENNKCNADTSYCANSNF